MNKRREIMRIAGWTAIVWGLATVGLAIATDLAWADLAGGYGLLFILTGAWTVTGIELLVRHERRVSEARAASPIAPKQQGVISR